MAMQRVVSFRAGLKGGSALFMSMAVMGAAFAQAPVAQGEGTEIVVTGSRIPRPDVQANSPVNVVGEEEIKLAVTNETEQLLNAIPQAVSGAGAQSNSGNGSATVNLRNLGAVRTLVLQNGRRIVGASQDGVVDLNMIPPSLVSRVEVVTGGASAVYGSDAMAGVVNFVMKDDFEGLEIDGSYGISEEGDAERLNLGLTVGGNFAEGRGNMVFHGSYFDRAQVRGAARDHAVEFFNDAIVDGEPVLIPAGNGVTPQGTIFSPQLVGLTDPYGDNIGTAGIFFAPEGWRAYRPSDGFNDRPFTNLQMPMQRWQGTVIGHYDVTENVSAFWEGSYVHSKINSTLGAVPMSSSGFIPGFQLDIRNPYLDPTLRDFLSANLDGDGDSLVPVNINRRLLDGGSRTSDQTRDFYRFVVGLEGDLTDRLNWELFYNQGQTKVTDVQGGGVLIDNFANGFLTDPNDPYSCATDDPDCVVLNPFGLNSLTPEMIDYINTDLTNITTIRQKQVGANITGSLFTLPAGDVGVSLGAEYRKESSAFDPDQLYVMGKALSRSAGLSPTAGSFDVAEVYTELYVPLLADMPGVELLAFEGGARFSDYSTAGSVWSYKLGGEYSPVRSLKFRGLYQRAVRAPNVVELFSGATNTAPQAVDFCNATPERTAAERDFCVDALGIPSAVIDVFQQENQQIRAITGGNPNLQEETSDTWSVGAVIRPDFVPNLQLTVDYYNIKIVDAIGSFGGGLQAVITACNSDLSLDNVFCVPLGNRTPDGQLYDVPLLNANIASLETSGIDYRLDYRHNLGSAGSLNYYIAGTYLIDSVTQGSPIANPVDCAGYIGGGSCSTANPTWRLTQRLTWDMERLQVSLRHRFIGSAKDGRIAGARAAELEAPLLAVPETGDVHYFDLSANFNVMENASFYAAIDNLFDRDPPFYLYERETYDAIGRRFTVGFRSNF
ncbi:TonB-dependent receptor domain-containing protein [Pacificimonas sp. ICDLI1SI03]